MIDYGNLRHELVTIMKAAAKIVDGKSYHLVQGRSADNVSTNLDFEINNFLEEHLRKLYDCPIISEETFVKFEKIEKEYVWIIDPIDGTLNLLAGTKNIAISVALLDAKNMTPVVASIAMPSNQTILSAAKGTGSFHNHMPLPGDVPQNRPDILSIGIPDDAYLFADEIANKLRWLIENKWIIRQGGAAAIDICLTVLKNWKGFWEQNLYLWDFVAAELIATESGCIVHKKKRDKKLLRYDLLITVSDEVSNRLLPTLFA